MILVTGLTNRRGTAPPAGLLWRLVKAAVLLWHTPAPSQTGWHTEPYAMSPLLLLIGLGLGGYLAVWRKKRALKVKARRRR